MSSIADTVVPHLINAQPNPYVCLSECEERFEMCIVWDKRCTHTHKRERERDREREREREQMKTIKL